jgi:hypothetical protein
MQSVLFLLRYIDFTPADQLLLLVLYYLYEELIIQAQILFTLTLSAITLNFRAVTMFQTVDIRTAFSA